MPPVKNYAPQKRSNAYARASSQGGFSLIEAIIVLAIFTTITSLTLFNYPRFANRVDLDNLTQEIALAIREAQVYGISIRATEGVATAPPAHGIHFDFPGGANSVIISFILFADTVGNNRRYTPGAGGDRIVRTFALGRGHAIISIEGDSKETGEPEDIDTLDIAFRRPNPEAILNDQAVGVSSDGEYSSVRITVRSPRGETRVVTVSESGRIATQ